MALRDILVALAVLVVVLLVLGWRRGRRLQALFDSVWDLRLGGFAGYHHGRIEEVPLRDRALTQTLLYSQSLIQFGFARGIEPATENRPHRNLTGDPYFTDGLRAVLVFERRPVSLDEVEVFEWERPGTSAGATPPTTSIRLASGT